MNMHSDGADSINAWLSDTISSVFPYVYTADVPNTTNKELFACFGGDPAELLAQHLSSVGDVRLRNLLRTVRQNLTSYVPGSHLLTDDQAPVEVLGMRMIDGLIEEELQYYKDIYAEKGLSGLLSELT